MSKLANIIGFSLFGLAARFGQLGIQKRNLFESKYLSQLFRYPDALPDFSAHVVSMGVFGYAGYWAWRWDQYATVLIQQKKAEIQQNRRERLEQAETQAARLLTNEEAVGVLTAPSNNF